MKKNTALVLVLAALCTFLFFGCVTIPPKEVHSATGLSRTVVLDPTPVNAIERRFNFGAGVGHGTSYRDNGDSGGAFVVDAYGEIKPVKTFALGLKPAYTKANGGYDSTASLGWDVYGRWAFLNFERTRVSILASFQSSQNEASDEGEFCTGLFSCIPSGEHSLSTVSLLEPKAAFIFEYQLDPKNGLAIVPAVHFTQYRSKNVFRDRAVWDYEAFRMGYSGMAYYKYFAGAEMEGGTDIAIIAGLGASVDRGFGPSAGDTRINPIGTVGVQISLGESLEKTVPSN